MYHCCLTKWTPNFNRIVCFLWRSHIILKIFTAHTLVFSTPLHSFFTHRSSSSSSHRRGYSSHRMQQRPPRCRLISILSQVGLHTYFRMMISGIQTRNIAYVQIQTCVWSTSPCGYRGGKQRNIVWLNDPNWKHLPREKLNSKGRGGEPYRLSRNLKIKYIEFHSSEAIYREEG